MADLSDLFTFISIQTNQRVMRRLIILLFAFVIITACNNDNKMKSQNEKGIQTDDKARKDDRDEGDSDEDGINNKDRDKNSNSQYNWKVAEQNKFLEDCRRDSEGHVAKNKTKDFCSCMLTQAQKYYPSYRQMDEKSNEEHDKEIIAQCLGEYEEAEN
jgi:hypothetical protein